MPMSYRFALLLATVCANPVAAQNYSPYHQPPVEVPVELLTGHWGGTYLGVQLGRVEGTLHEAAGDSDGDATSFGIHGAMLADYGYLVTGAALSYDRLSDVSTDSASGDGRLLAAKFMAGYDTGQVLPYAMIGLSRISLDGVFGDGGDADGNGWLVGIGAKFRAAPDLTIGAEMLHHEFSDFNDVDGDDLTLTTFGISAAYRF